MKPLRRSATHEVYTRVISLRTKVFETYCCCDKKNDLCVPCMWRAATLKHEPDPPSLFRSDGVVVAVVVVVVIVVVGGGLLCARVCVILFLGTSRSANKLTAAASASRISSKTSAAHSAAAQAALSSTAAEAKKNSRIKKQRHSKHKSGAAYTQKNASSGTWYIG